MSPPGVVVAEETVVQPHLLRGRAGDCRDLRSGIGRMMSDVEPETSSAAGGLQGWMFRRALQELLQKQNEDMTKLGSRLEATAVALEQSATAYERGERVNAELFRRAEQPW